jgi:asparagine synthase (glutamine-hydrolysing)
MCGIVGFVDPKGFGSMDSARELLYSMARKLSHRGPDDEGVWVDAGAGVALGHRRLAVIDLSPQGRQPMESADGRYVISFNGEIYNFQELRRELEQEGSAPPWRGHSDTEVLLAAIAAWGPYKALCRSTGMFALALYDKQERTLFLARDRMGEKPLYYGWANGTFLFASELKALRVCPGWKGEIDQVALGLLLRHNYIPAPRCIYRDVRKLPAGSFLKLEVSSTLASGNRWPDPTKYWDPLEVALKGQKHPFPGSEREAMESLGQLLGKAVQGQMISDVPLGAFLSGGIDSSTIVALMQATSSRPVRTFTVGFDQWDYNEAADARLVAEHLGTDHTEIYVSPQKAQEVIPQLPLMYDEPFSDSSQIPTHLIAHMARQHVTVSLSGDGGDELFGGYPRYFQAEQMWRRIGWMPHGLRLGIAKAIRSQPPNRWDRAFGWSGPLLLGRRRSPRVGDKLFKLADILDFGSSQELYWDLVSHWRPSHGILVWDGEPQSPLQAEPWPGLPDFFHKMMFWDMVTYLPDDILVKVDRAAMAVSLETRMPFLDHRVVEFAWSLPLSMKVRDGKGKWILRQLLHRHVPRDLVDRPKMGFGVPIGEWLRGPLRSWVEDLLEEKDMRQRGLIKPEPVRRKWEEHLSGRRNWQYLLWDVLMLQAWLRHWHP